MRLRTEFGIIDVEPGEVAVIPRGVKFSAELPNGPVRGYLCENYGGALTLPERGPIGANCLANPRDFLTPVAAYEDRDIPSKLTVKWGGSLWVTEIAHSPLDVVAWHGNYAPYKYDLRRFSPVGPVLFDHADPSIFTVYLAFGNAGYRQHRLRDLFRSLDGGRKHLPPPWYHMNVMSEFMGLSTASTTPRPAAASCRAASRCTTRCCRTAPTWTPSKVPATPISSRTSLKARWPSCSRRAFPAGDRLCRRPGAAAAGLRRLWSAAAQAPQSRAALRAERNNHASQ